MSLAEQKLNQNIAEYILFMWQMEDLVRAVCFDPESLDDFIRSYTPSPEAFETEKKWFKDLVRKMRSERVEQRGHIGEVHELIFELNYLHNTLINVIRDKVYLDLYKLAQPNIREYMV
jgi:Mg2+ and Co2+ transporter CorA